MKRSAKYVGLDVHPATTVATVRDSSGRIIARGILPTAEVALLEFFRRDAGRGVTLARKIAAVTLRLWKKGEPYDARKLTLQAA